MGLRRGDFVIGDDTPLGDTHPTGFGRGLVPRDYEKHPVGCYAAAPEFDLPLIPRDEWVDRIKDMDANKTRLSDIRRSSGPNGGAIPALDQNGQGYCWAHSTTMALILLRAVSNQPYVRLSAFMVACLIKNYRDEGGWGALSLDFVQTNGVPSVEFWPEKSMSRSNDNPQMRENAKKHIATEGWADLSASVYDRNFTEDQAMTLLLSRNPVVGDFNWWSHSICLMDPVLVNARKAPKDLGSLDLNTPKDRAAYSAAFGKRLINSWTDQWGDRGEGVLTGDRAHLDGGVAPRATTASPT